MFGDFIPSDWIEAVLKAIRDSGSKATFLFLTRNPWRYTEFEDLYTDNMILGVTLETNLNYDYFDTVDFWHLMDILKIPYRHKKLITSSLKKISLSPPPRKRYIHYLEAMEKIGHPRRFISIEPILFFDPHLFPTEIMLLDPELIYIGYDNYRWKLPEPPLHLTLNLIKTLEENNYTVHRKTIRKAWWEANGTKNKTPTTVRK